MSPLRFTPVAEATRPVDLSPLTPENLTNLTVSQIERLEVFHGSEVVVVGDLFRVSGNDPEQIEIEDASSAFEHIGDDMRQGTIRVEGDAGAFVGCNMSGGSIAVAGCAGDFCANSMRGGLIQIDGDCGDYLGGGLPGSKLGMNEGCVIVRGNVGIRMADHMRRGLIIVFGDVGPGACSAMIAGTAVLLGRTGEHLGVHMKRGSIFCARPPSFSSNRFFRQSIATAQTVSLIQRNLDELGINSGILERLRQPKNRYVGDLSFGGQGEIVTFEN